MDKVTSVTSKRSQLIIFLLVFVPAGRFIRGVLFAYGLQLQHLNPNNI
jgi:hypothetical protein